VRNCSAGFFFAVVTLLAQSVPRTSDGKPTFRESGCLATPPGFDVTEIAEGHEIPYLPEALERSRRPARRSHRALRHARVPRITYMPFPFRFMQPPDTSCSCTIHARQRIVKTTPRDHLDGIDLWLGDSVGRWEGDTLVIDVNNLRPETWLDSARHTHSEALARGRALYAHRAGHHHLRGTIDDPKNV